MNRDILTEEQRARGLSSECRAGHVECQQSGHPVVHSAPAQGVFTGEQGGVHGEVSDKRLSHQSV